MASEALITDKTVTWGHLPVEIRLMILEALLQNGCSVASSAVVSREWQAVIEPYNFSQIYLTLSRLDGVDTMLRRNRALVKYIWFRIELESYGCWTCAPAVVDDWSISETDNTTIMMALEGLFLTLSAWPPGGDLVLDISVYSPSDSKHWFKYLTCEPDTPPSEYNQNRLLDQVARIKPDGHQHIWNTGNRDSVLHNNAIDKLFEDIMAEGPFIDDEEEWEWFQQLPAVPAVTGFLLRQQTRRRWKPLALLEMFARFPRLRDIHLEPWREWESDRHQEHTDKCYRALFKFLASTNLRRLVLFENFNQIYPRSYPGCKPFRIPDRRCSKWIAIVSLQLDHLSASFIVDASYFFDARKPSWEWPNLTSLALTSRLLTPDEGSSGIDSLLRAAAAAAMKMPKLQIMEIWNGREGLAALFRYQVTGGRYPPVLTWKATWALTLQPSMVQLWEAAASKHGGSRSIRVVHEVLPNNIIGSHGDALRILEPLNTVIRPISLQQIEIEHQFH
ncbi:hypothetical protein F5B19DRAFT_499121 [Rostrohypoxylon terebratum]|nr:hypothetical protein F5B19DRAFT_499121 [Rostrohypoxylon terebratum]